MVMLLSGDGSVELSGDGRIPRLGASRNSHDGSARQKKQGATGITTVAPYVAGQWGRGDNRLPE